MQHIYAPYLSYVALAFYVSAMLVRSTIMLRVLLLAGTTSYIGYYAFVGDSPLWDAIFASLAIGAANLFMLTRIVLERSTFGMDARMLALFERFTTFNPGQFKRIMRLADWQSANTDLQVCTIGQVPKGLYFIIDGEVDLIRKDKTTTLTGSRFVGELSFLLDQDATANATVIIKSGTSFVVWERTPLRAMMDKSDPLSNAFAALFNKDLSHKLHASWPEDY